MSTSERLTAIVRERYETGAHGNAFLMMSKATTDTIPRPEPRPWLHNMQGFMLDIPVILDAALPVGAWRLLDRTTGEEIESEGVPRTSWAQAIEALRALAAESDVTEPRPWTDQGVYLEAAEALEDLLALTEEGGQ